MWSRLLIATGAALAVSLVVPSANAQRANAQIKNALGQLNYKQPSYNPNAEMEKRLRKLGLTSDPGRRQGRAVSTPNVPSATQDRLLRRFDSDRDGEITQQEYYSGKSRGGNASGFRARKARARMRSNFRAADRDRNGRLSTQELGTIGNPRF